MKRKPLKISWKSWCLYKLTSRDYSAYELKQAIIKRASESDQTVDPEPIIAELEEEGLIDDRRYIQNQISISLSGSRLKGPKEVKRKLQQKGGIKPDLVSEYINESDQKWFEAASIVVKNTLSAKNIHFNPPQEIPIKIVQNLRQKLFRKGFTKQQIEHALNGIKAFYPKKEKNPNLDFEKEIRRMKSNGKGPAAISHYLKETGVEIENTENLLDIYSEEWIIQARELLLKKYGNQKRLSKKEKKKQFDYLFRRGFLAFQIQKVLENMDQC